MSNFTPQAVQVVQAYAYKSDFARTWYGTMLKQEEARAANFFTRHGFITKSGMDTAFETPLQQVDDFEGNKRIDTMRTYIGDLLRGNPDVGAHKTAPEDPVTIKRSIFEFRTIDMYGPVLDIPDSNREYSMAISIYGQYGSQLRQWWQAVIENLIWINLTGMRGQGRNWRAIDAIQEIDPANVSTSKTTTFTEFMKDVHEINPITAPEKQLATWHTNVVKTGQTLSATTATVAAANNITFSLINDLSTWLETRSSERMGLGFNKPEIRNLPSGADDAWAWMIPPEVARRIRTQFSTGTVEWQNYEIAKVQGGMKNTGFRTGWIGTIFGIHFVKADALPRYLGGASNDVPIARTLILGKSALVFGFRTREMNSEMLARFNHMGKSVGRYGAAINCWVTELNKGRRAALQSKCDFGVRKIRIKNFDAAETEVDKGVLAIDVPYQSMETQGI